MTHAHRSAWRSLVVVQLQRADAAREIALVRCVDVGLDHRPLVDSAEPGRLRGTLRDVGKLEAGRRWVAFEIRLGVGAVVRLAVREAGVTVGKPEVGLGVEHGLEVCDGWGVEANRNGVVWCGDVRAQKVCETGPGGIFAYA